MVEETSIFTVMKNLEDLVTFLKGQDVSHASSDCQPAQNQNAPLIIAVENSKKIHLTRVIYNTRNFRDLNYKYS